MTEQSIVPMESSGGALMPVMGSDLMLERYQTIVEIKDKVMKEGVHYGAIPGAGDKPTLLKPGAEVLCTAFMLYPEFETLNEPNLETLFNGLTEPGKVPFFQYRYRCTLKSRDGRFTVGTGIGSCSSWEKKYRYRNAERVCPTCGKNAIIKGKAEYGGGWLCFDKKGGCKAKFNDGDARIEGQQVGQVDNPDIAEVINTIDKMGQKRSLIAATLVAVGASDFFTQDVEDLPEFSGSSPVVIKTVQPAQPVIEGVVVGEAKQTAQSAPQDASTAAFTQHAQKIGAVEPSALDEHLGPRPEPASIPGVTLGVAANTEDITDLLEINCRDLKGNAPYRVQQYAIAHSGTNAKKHYDNRYKHYFGRNVLTQLNMTVADFVQKMATPSTEEAPADLPKASGF